MPSLSFASLKDNIAVVQPLCGLVNNNQSNIRKTAEIGR
jgi:hypothetical protein